MDYADICITAPQSVTTGEHFKKSSVIILSTVGAGSWIVYACVGSHTNIANLLLTNIAR